MPPAIVRDEKASPVSPSEPPAAPDCLAAGDLRTLVAAYERQVIGEAISRLCSKRKAAEALGVDIGTIVRKTQSALIKAAGDPRS